MKNILTLKLISMEQTILNQTDKAIGILEKVCDYSRISRDDLASPSRQQTIVLYRQLAIYFMLRDTKLSLNQIGRLFGGRDHATILHSRDKINTHINIGDRLVMKPYRELCRTII